ncbi:MAG: hypothetical protein H7301_00665 [Cryobacterium sp.]|nr:hypothetical protein [Oligoflexia bacterium]
MRSCLVGLIVFALFFGSLQPSQAKDFVSVYPEKGDWTLHWIRIDRDGFPVTIERSRFSDRSQAELQKKKTVTDPAPSFKNKFVDNNTALELRPSFTDEIWHADRSWDENWETRYSSWIRENFDPAFFKRYGIRTDCADAAIALRWIFSRIHFLPAGNHLVGTRALFTNRSMKPAWKRFPTNIEWFRDRRFLAALDYLMLSTSTHTLVGDAYPISVNPSTLTEGSFHLEIRNESGHARIISKISTAPNVAPVFDTYSNVPRKIRVLWTEPFLVYSQPILGHGGFLKYRWVNLSTSSASLAPSESMPGYSLEQYRPDFFRHGIPDFSAEVAARFQETFDPLAAQKLIYQSIKSALQERIGLVQKGYVECQRIRCVPGSDGYDVWSTPSRDSRIKNSFEQIQNYLTSLHGEGLSKFRTFHEIEKVQIYLVFHGEKFRYGDLESLWLSSRISSDPRVTPRKRWGLD